VVVRDRFSGAVMAYLQNERNEQANFESLRHFAGRYLLDKKGVLLVLELAGFQIHQFQVFGLTTRAVRERERGQDIGGIGKTGSRCRRFPSEALAVVG